jgi:hypothetical protein
VRFHLTSRRPLFIRADWLAFLTDGLLEALDCSRAGAHLILPFNSLPNENGRLKLSLFLTLAHQEYWRNQHKPTVNGGNRTLLYQMIDSQV